MRLAVFIAGKSFYGGFRSCAPGRRIDFPRMAGWLAGRIEGVSDWTAHYYTGIETGADARSIGQQNLARFLDMLEAQPGFVVHRIPRRDLVFRCQACHGPNRLPDEREVDTTLAVDMVRLAAQDAFDALLLVCGEAEHGPAVAAASTLGKASYAAAWGKEAVPPSLLATVGEPFDLVEGLADFECEAPAASAAAPADGPQGLGMEPVTLAAQATDGDLGADGPDDGAAPHDVTDEDERVFLDELRRAERHFKSGYVGASYFLTRWQSKRLERSAEIRGKLLDRLIQAGKVQLYAAPDGRRAVRAKP